MIEERKKSLHPISVVLCEIYEALAGKGEVAFVLYDEQINKIDSVVKTVQANYFGFARFPDPEDKATAYFCLIIKDHVVTDGNKRLAVMFLEFYCITFSLKLSLPDNVTLDQVAVSVEKSTDERELIQLTKKVLFR